MKVVLVYLRLYAQCVSKGLDGIRRNLWTLLLPMGLVLALSLAKPVVASLGVLAGLALSLLMAAAISCYLYFTSEVVAHAQVRLSELKTSIGAYFWSVMNLLFVLWIIDLILAALFSGHQNGAVLQVAVNLVLTVLLNPAPEVIYRRGTHNGLETVQQSIRFLQENWIEWFIPNLLVLAAGYVLFTRALPSLGLLGGLIGTFGSGALLHVWMVFRGHLFGALDGSTHRQRMFRYGTAS